MKKILVSILAATVAFNVCAQKTYKNPVYGSDFPDPTVQRAKDGTFYAYATGCQCKKSTSLISWTDVPGVISRPTWNDSTKADGSKDYYSLWAADVSYVNGKYVCYYASALWGNGSRTGIGVAVGDTPYKFTDKGKVFRSTEIGVENSIDPCYVEEFDKKYLVWGSFNDICMVELTDDALAVRNFTPLNNPNNNPDKTRHKGVTKIAGGAFEGAMIYKRGQYYYLFCSVGSCCEGANSTYRTVVGRSTKLTGPYVNKQGGQMLSDNYTTIISGNDRWKGPGHNSEIITDDNGDDWLLYHSYDKNNGYKGRLMLLDKINWGSDGWPTINDGHPSSDAMPAPVFYTGDGANITYKFDNMDLMYSGWKCWNVTKSDDCDMNSGRGSAFMPLGYAKGAGSFDASQTLTGQKVGIYEMQLENFSSEGGVDLYVGNLPTAAFHPASIGLAAPATESVISTNFLRANNKFIQKVYGISTKGTLTVGMRTRDTLKTGERFYAGNVKVIYREKNAELIGTLLKQYSDYVEQLGNSKGHFYRMYPARIANYIATAEASEDNTIRYNQLVRVANTVDSIMLSIDNYASLEQQCDATEKAIEEAKAGGYYSDATAALLAQARESVQSQSLTDKEITALIQELKTSVHNMIYSYQKGDGSKENPYIISRPEQLDHMRDVMVKEQMVYFEMDNDVDMKDFVWEQLNTSATSYRNWFCLDGKGHIIHNLTPNGKTGYPSFAGTLCGEIRNVGFVNAKVEGAGSGAAIVAGTLGHSTFKDAEENLFPVVVENCYMTGVIVSKGYVGAVGGTLNNSPIFIRNCYSTVDIEGNGSATNYSGGLVGRIRTDLTLERSYAAGDVISPVAGGVVAGNQASTTPISTYNNVIAWNQKVGGANALPFGTTAAGDILTDVYYLADMTVNDLPVEGGKTHAELQQIAASWGAPWHSNPAAGNGYPILQWQYERGDFHQLCGFDMTPEMEDGISAAEVSDAQHGTGLIFNLAGQRVSKVQKGIFIQEGKKVLR